MKRRELTTFILGILCAISVHAVFSESPVLAQSEIDILKTQINNRNNQLSKIEQEISQYKTDLQKVGSEKNTLQRAINQLELERKKVKADISYTQNKIGATDLEISKLIIEIDEANNSIALNEDAIAEIIRRIDESDKATLIEAVLTYDNLTEFWSQIEKLQQVRGMMGTEVKNLISLKKLLENKHVTNSEKRDELIGLRDQYSDQNEVLVNNKYEKDKLLKTTKNKEGEYQNLLSSKQSTREQILKELREFESKLQFILEPNTIPLPGTSVFNWPFTNIIITQPFGGTEFAKRNSSIYGGRAYHPGIDIGTPRGTQIHAPLAGTVRATGNTDAVPGCLSWGKWTLVDHANGLSTLYAHQDTISVSPGQKVETGEIIGYTGNTGYSTGPHLHFTVYATAGVTVRKFNEIKTVTSCGPASTPVAATDAYLDPELYLPAL